MEGQIKTGRAILSFLFLPVGIITYFKKKPEDEKAAKAYLTITIVGALLRSVMARKLIQS